MLRIILQPSTEALTVLKLEGKLLEPWLDEVQRSIPAPVTLQLDLSTLSFADGAGVRFLRGLIRQGAQITACSAFIAALLQMENA
jgi:ABC-type transporter Mla MlaB component